MAASLTWRQALAWRMRRQLLDPVGSPSVAKVVDRLCGVQAQVASSAELAVRVRRRMSRRGEVGRAVSDGRLIRTWAMRGALHVVTPELGAALLSIMAPDRLWDRWGRYLGATAAQMDALRSAIRNSLRDGPLTRVELADAVMQRRGLGTIGHELRSSWGGILKPLAWQGDLCFGPNRGTQVTFTLPERASSRWTGLLDPDEAAPLVIGAYLRAYGPATFDSLADWLGGSVDRRRLRAWFRGLGDRVVEVAVDGEPANVLVEDLDELAATKPTSAVRLLPGFDQYVLGPGTADGRVVPPSRRTAVSRQAGWISPVVVAGGVVCGTWALERDEVRVTWFGEAGRPPRSALRVEAARLSTILDRDLRAAVTVA